MSRSFRIWPILALIALLLFTAGATVAVPQLHAQGSTTLTLDDAIRIAMERSIDLKRAANSIASSNIAIQQERAAYDPSLSVSLSPSERFGRSFDQTTGTVSTQRSEGLSLGASSSLTLFNGFATRASVAEAEAQLTSDQASLGRAQQTIVFDVVQGFLQVVLDSALITVEQDNIAAEQLVLERVNAYAQAGKRAVADVYTEQATLASDELRLLNAQHSYELDKARLKQTLQLDPLTEYTFVSPTIDTTAPPVTNYSYDQLLQNVMDSRADVAAERARIAAAEENIKVAKAGYWPTVSVSAGIGTSYSSQNITNDFSNQLFNTNPSANVGLSISLPIFDRRQTESSEQRAIIARDNELLTLQALQQQIALDVRSAILDYETAAKQVAVGDRQITAAGEALRAQEARYSVGASTLVELQQARAAYLSAKSNRIQALYTLVLRQRAIEYYHGTIVVPGR